VYLNADAYCFSRATSAAAPPAGAVVEFDDLPNLRGVPAEGEETSSVQPTPPPGAGISPNPVTQLVADLLETTGLVAPDRLAAARSRAGTGSIAEALVDEGLAQPAAETPPATATSSMGRIQADHSHLPTVDLAAEGVDKAAAQSIPTHVLERAVAIPYKLEDNRLYVAVADPTNVQAIDELRIATRHTLEIGVAPPEDIELELRRIVRATEAWERAALVEDELVEAEEGDSDDLEADDGVSDAPLVRLVNSIILQAAEDGASDLHFDPQDDALVVRLRIDGVLHEVQRIPKRLAPGVTTRLKFLAKLDIAERR
jgi:type IV pilus assembly protein PilB